MKSFFRTLLFVLVATTMVDASANWDGPMDAAIDNLAAVLQFFGFSGAGVRPFGYGFEVREIEDSAAPDDGGRRRNRRRRSLRKH